MSNFITRLTEIGEALNTKSVDTQTAETVELIELSVMWMNALFEQAHVWHGHL